MTNTIAITSAIEACLYSAIAHCMDEATVTLGENERELFEGYLADAKDIARIRTYLLDRTVKGRITLRSLKALQNRLLQLDTAVQDLIDGQVWRYIEVGYDLFVDLSLQS